MDVTLLCLGAAVLLIKAIAAWKAEHGDPPSSSAERRAFKQVIQGWRHTIDGIPVEEENFEVRLLVLEAAMVPVGVAGC